MSVIRKGKAEIKVTSGKFFGVKAGENATVALLTDLDEILSIDQHTFWREGGNSPSFPCIGKGCPGCERGDQPRFRGFLNVLTPEGDVKVWSFPISVYKSLEELDETAGSLKGMALKVRATQKGKFTNTTIVPTGKRVKVDGHELLNVEELLGPTDREGILELLAKNAGEEDEDDPFADEKVEAAAKKAAAKAAPKALPAEATTKKAPPKESTAPVEPEDEEDETPKTTEDDSDPWD